MSYQVLARKWRPHNFQTMVGQTHVVRALQNAMKKQRLHHAYLFSGTRGVGKTTIARIIAKCLNCEQGVTQEPCEQCSACNEINSGRFVDLIEVDAASRTRVEDTRELLDNVQYRPTRGRYKVYLIDEVHMLSGHSFNALLKTLEEPPPHVKFLLATTDPQKLPATVLSRCLQFHLKNLKPEQISHQLAHILTEEALKFDEQALDHIANAARGSMRDALSILDQAIAYSEGDINECAVQKMLGIVESTQLIELITSLNQHDGNALLKAIDALAQNGSDFNNALSALLQLLHDIAWQQALPQNAPKDAALTDLSSELTAEQVQLYYQIGLLGQRDLGLAPNTRCGFEMVLLRMLAFTPGNTTTSMVNNQPTKVTPQQPPKPQLKPTTTAPTLSTPSTQKHPATPQTNTTTNWSDIVQALNLKGPTLALANHCALKRLTETEIELTLDPQQTPLLNPAQQQRINQALNQHYQRPLELIITTSKSAPQTPAREQQAQADSRQKQAQTEISADPKLKTLLQSFGGNVLQKTINPV